jgi:phosphoribosylglycinamide formyltransferase-1
VSAAPPRRGIAVLLSGRGSNMQNLVLRSREPEARFEVVRVFCDQPAARGLAVAHELGIPTQTLAARDFTARAAYDRALGAAVAAVNPALVVLAGFMRILSSEFLRFFPGRVMNIHPSLLPKYPGLHTHERVLAAREREHGCTVHFVTEELDAGPLIVQGRVAIAPTDDGANLAARVQAQEHRIYPLAIDWFCAGRLEQRDGRAWLDGQPLLEPVQLAPLGN